MKHILTILIILCTFVSYGRSDTIPVPKQGIILKPIQIVIDDSGTWYLIPLERAYNLAQKASKGLQYKELAEDYMKQRDLIANTLHISQNELILTQKSLFDCKNYSSLLLQKFEKTYRIAEVEKASKLEWKEKAKKYKKQRNKRSGVLYTVTSLGIGFLVYSIIQNN